jgi:hypothetical protein
MEIQNSFFTAETTIRKPFAEVLGMASHVMGMGEGRLRENQLLLTSGGGSGY